MEELNGRMIACQILVTGLIARVANDSKDPLRFLTDFRDEIPPWSAESELPGRLTPTASGKPPYKRSTSCFPC